MNSELYRDLPPARLFFRCAIPAAVTSVFGALYSVVDGIFVGRYLGENALAAINLIMPVIIIVESLSNMIATGASVNISMLLGEGKREDASSVFSFSVKFILIFSCIIATLGYFFAEPFVALISPEASEEAIKMGVEYLKTSAVFCPLIPIYFALDNYLRVCGRQTFSMVINIISQVLNVILDFVLIAVLKKGVREAAIASCVSIVTGSVIMLLAFTGKRTDVYYTGKNIPASQFFHIVVNGSSEFFSSISASLMSLVLNVFLLKTGGTTAVAAFSVVMYVDSIIGMLNFGICDSLQPAISYCYGAGLPSRVKSIFRTVLISSAVVSFAAFLFMLLGGPYTAKIFINPNDSELLKMSVTAIRIFAFSYLVGWVDMSYSSYFTALDRPGLSLITSVCGTLVFPLCSLVILTAVRGLNGVWIHFAVAAAASAVLSLFLANYCVLNKFNGERHEVISEK